MLKSSRIMALAAVVACVPSLGFSPEPTLAEGPSSTASPRPPSAGVEVPSFEPEDVDTEVAIGYGLAIGDVDGDGKPDILLADRARIVWYRNPEWTRFVLCERLTKRDNVCIDAEDIDGDGRVEVAIGADWDPGDTLEAGSLHYLLAPADPKRLWEAIDLPPEPTVHRLRWALGAGGTYHLVVAPLHGRGNKGGQGVGAKVRSYSMGSDPRKPWSTEVVDDRLHVVHNLELVNWDGDPEHEILLAGREGVVLCDRSSEGWRPKQLVGNKPGETDFQGASEIRAGTLPGGERYLATVEPFHGHQAVVYTAPSEGGALWERRVIDSDLRQGHAVACADLAASGSGQLIVGWRGKNRDGRVGINLYVPLDASGESWKRVTIDDDRMACEDLKVADLNGDGRLDVIAAGRGTHNVKVYWNRGR